MINCNCHCVSGDCSGFHVASVPNSDLGSLSAAVRAAPSHLGAHTGRQTKVSKAHRKSWFSLLWWNWPTVNVSWCCVCVCINCIFVSLYVLVLRGDYRTGKRLNMRKVIPYIASQFRKDKIWLRRTKPSKREYQICLAVDDSSSMVDNHSKQVRGSSYNQMPIRNDQ